MVAPSDPFKTGPSISKSTAYGVLLEYGSFSTPLWHDLSVAGREREWSDALYDMAAERGHDPARWLAIGVCENQLGRDPDSVLWRNDTRSLTNARTIRDPALLRSATIITDPVRGSEYVKYHSVLDSVQDGIYRVDDPSYAYAGKRSIAEVLSVWDEGDWRSYATAVAGLISLWQKREAAVTQAELSGLDWAPSGSYGYPTRGTVGRSGATVDRLIIHTSEGGYKGSLSWLQREPKGDDEGSSTHAIFSLDGTQAAQLVSLRNAAWTAGSRAFNERGVNFEHEGYAKKGGWSDAMYRRSARAAAEVMGILPAIRPDRAHIIGHSEVPNPVPSNDPNYCGPFGGSGCHQDPGPLWDWAKYLDYIHQALGSVPNPPASAVIVDDVTKKVIVDSLPDGTQIGFATYWQTGGGIFTYGRPLTGAFVEQVSNESGAFLPLVVQYFERSVFEAHPENAAPYQVLLRRLGAVELARQYPKGAPA